jgi:hypothetical protein
MPKAAKSKIADVFHGEIAKWLKKNYPDHTVNGKTI